jgi:hypothetical protein
MSDRSKTVVGAMFDMLDLEALRTQAQHASQEAERSRLAREIFLHCALMADNGGERFEQLAQRAFEAADAFLSVEAGNAQTQPEVSALQTAADVLEQLEWSPFTSVHLLNDETSEGWCPICRNPMMKVHAADCKLEAVLKAAGRR